MYPLTRISPGKIDQEWLDSESTEASIAIFLIPLAGIAFIWFKGVIRDRLGNREDRFFATIFLGSGLIIVGILFVWGATIGVIFGSYVAVAEVPFGADVVVFDFKFMH